MRFAHIQRKRYFGFWSSEKPAGFSELLFHRRDIEVKDSRAAGALRNESQLLKIDPEQEPSPLPGKGMPLVEKEFPC